MTKKVLIIDDSALMRRVLSDIIENDNRFVVDSTAAHGLDALDQIVKEPKRFDLAILDINMPKMNGIEFLERIEKLNLSLKVIVVSTVAKEGAKETIRCLELGAFDFVTKPESFIEARGDVFRQRIIQKLCIAAGFEDDDLPLAGSEKEKKDTGIQKSSGTNVNVKQISALRAGAVKVDRKPFKPVGKASRKLVALACSTGGPKALNCLVPMLPKNLNAPVVIVQHMPEGFTNSLAQRLDELSEIHVKEAEDGEMIQKGVVYIAKGGNQLRLKQNGISNLLQVTVEEARNGLRPCADIMYESLLECDFDEIICVVLTGMGADGTMGISQLNETKNIYVISQTKETCIVYGMPKVLAEAGLSDEVVPLEKIADSIIKIVGVH